MSKPFSTSGPVYRSRPWGRTPAFTLIELLGVLAVLLLLVSAAMAVFNGPRYGISVQGGVDACASMVEQASHLARANRAPGRLVFNVDPGSPGFARQAALFLKTAGGQWVLRGGPIVLTDQVYFDDAYCAGGIAGRFDLSKRTPQDDGQGTKVIAYEFDRNGQFQPSGGAIEPRIILVAGVIAGTSSRTLDVNAEQAKSRDGFLLRRNGYVTRYESLEQILATKSSAP